MRACTASRLGLLMVLFALMTLSGCGKPERKIVRVSGTVTRGEKPVPNLFLNFLPEAGRPSWGVTDAQGRYSLHYDNRRDGAVVGTHKVFVDFRPGNPDEENAFASGAKQRPQELNRILEKYGNMDKTPLAVEIKDDNQVVNLVLD